MNEKISELYDKIDFLNNIINTQIIENNKLKEKIEKAIENIKNINNKKIIDLNWEIEELLIILGDKE